MSKYMYIIIIFICILYEYYMSDYKVNIIFHINACKSVSYITHPNRLLFKRVTQNISLT